MNYISESMMAIFKGIFEYLKSFFLYLQGLWEDNDRKRRELIASQQQQMQKDRILSIMFNIASELSEVFRGKSYPCLMPIKHPADIRPKDFRILKNERTVFVFAVNKSTDIHMSESDLKHQQELLNADIERFLFEHFCNLSGMIYDEYPFLLQGVQIVGTKNSPRFNRELLIYVIVRDW